jgi:hypothetical protein
MSSPLSRRTRYIRFPRYLHEIATDIRRTLPRMPSARASIALDTMDLLYTPADRYGTETGEQIVRQFLDAIKGHDDATLIYNQLDELRRMIGEKAR